MNASTTIAFMGIATKTQKSTVGSMLRREKKRKQQHSLRIQWILRMAISISRVEVIYIHQEKRTNLAMEGSHPHIASDVGK